MEVAMESYQGRELRSADWKQYHTIVIASLFRDGMPYVLTLPCHRRGAKEVDFKLPGGMAAPVDVEGPLATAKREFREETGLFLDPEYCYSLSVDTRRGDNPSYSLQRHLKFYFYTEHWQGDLRTSPVWDGLDLLEVPEWMLVSDALDKLIPAHQKVLQKVLPLIAYDERCTHGEYYRPLLSLLLQRKKPSIPKARIQVLPPISRTESRLSPDLTESFPLQKQQ